MDRRSFLKGLAAGVSLAVVNPTIAAELERTADLPQEVIDKIVGHQPLNGPTGSVYYLQTKQSGFHTEISLEKMAVEKEQIPKSNLLDILLEVSDEFDGTVMEAAHDVAIKTKRGAANWVLSHPSYRIPKFGNTEIFYVDDPRLKGKVITGYSGTTAFDNQILCVDDRRYAVCDIPSRSRIVSV